VPDGWLVTGDRVERRGDRVYFLGREGSLINIGGAKVVPEEVESALLDVPGVLDLRAFAVANPITAFVIGLAPRNRHDRPSETTFLQNAAADPVRGRGAMRCER
jgi:acyl-coenzyme A synthetase/AMP-(fatty) acid ligase